MITRLATVTRAQAQVIAELACDGASNGTIAERLGISEETVKSHLKAALAAARCTNRTELAVALLRGRLKLRVTGVRGPRSDYVTAA